MVYTEKNKGAQSVFLSSDSSHSLTLLSGQPFQLVFLLPPGLSFSITFFSSQPPKSFIHKMSSIHSPVHPKVQWDCSKRQVLCCLYRFFHLNEEAFEQVFSEIFRRDLLERGFGNRGPSYRVLYAQWTWLRRTHSPIWLHVHRDTEFRLDTDWGPLLDRIQKAASRIGSGLIPKDEDDINLTKLENVDVSERLGEYLESVLLSVRTPLSLLYLIRMRLHAYY